LEMMKINEIKNTLDCITNRLHWRLLRKYYIQAVEKEEK
jgi:hypothetical protein